MLGAFEVGSERAPNVLGTRSERAPNVLGTCSERAPNVLGTRSERAPNVLGTFSERAPNVLAFAGVLGHFAVGCSDLALEGARRLRGRVRED